MKLKILSFLLLLGLEPLCAQTITIGADGSTNPDFGALKLTTTPRLVVTKGSGSPEGVITAAPGSLYLDTTGKTWKKSTGTATTGWVELATGGAASVTSVFGRTGTVTATAGDYTIAQITGANASNWDTAYTERRQWDGGATGLTAATGRTSLGLVIGTNVEAWDADLDTWATKTPYAGTFTLTTGKTFNVTNSLTLSGTDGSTLSIGAGGTLGSAAFINTNLLEPALGNPATDGFVLSSTTAGVRSWVAAGAGGGGVTSITGISPITASASTGAINLSLNVGVNHSFTAAQTIGTNNGVNNAPEVVLTLNHNTTATPANGLGVGMLFTGETGGVGGAPNTQLATFRSVWSDVSEATKTSKFEFLLADTGSVGLKMTLFGSGGLSINSAVDPGAGIVNANAGYIAGGSVPTTGHVLRSDGSKFVDGQVTGSDLVLSDVTTNNASTSAHGFLPKLDNNAAHYLDGTGAWTTPAGGAFNPAIDNVFTATQSITIAPAANTVVNGLELKDTTAAPVNGSQQFSPALYFLGNGRKTNATAASQPVEFRIVDIPIEGGAVPSGSLAIDANVNSTGWTRYFNFYSGGGLGVGGAAANPGLGVVNVATGLRIGGSAPSGHFLRGNGSNYVDGTVSGSDLVLSDVTTNDVSTARHGFAPKGDGNATHYLDGTGAYSLPAGGGGAASDTAFASSWNGATTTAPSQNAVYDWGHTFDTNDNGKVNVLDLSTAGAVQTDASGVVSSVAPGTDGNVLTASSGVWTSAAPPAGGGGVTSVGTTAPITGGPITTTGIIGLNASTDLGMTAQQTITLDNATNNLVSIPLQLRHNTTGTPANGLGTGISFMGESSTTVNREMGRVASAWSDVTDGTRAAYLDFLLESGGTLGSAMRLHASAGLSVNSQSDPGAGNISTSNAYRIGATAGTSGKILQNNGTDGYVASTPTWPTTAGTAGNLVQSDGTNFTSADAGAWDGILRVSGSDFTRTAQTLGDITGMVTPTLASGGLYEIRIDIFGQSSDSTGANFGVNSTGTSPTVFVWGTGHSSGTATTVENYRANNTAGTVRWTVATTDCGLSLQGFVNVGTGSPVFSVRTLKVTSGTVTIKIGSSLRYRRIQ